MKSIIGRAKESHAAAQVEYMSSVSHEVCEVWNGHSVVRIPGSPEIQMFVYVASQDERSWNKDGGPDLVRQRERPWTFGIFNLQDPGTPLKARGELYTWDLGTLLTFPDYGHNFTMFGKEEESSDQEKGASAKHPIATVFQKYKVASNITLNLSQSDILHLYLGAVLGIVLQVGVLAGSALFTYHPTWRLEKGGEPVEEYAFPLMCIGTILLVSGMFICATVIEQSTIEYAWTYSKDEVPGQEDLKGRRRDKVIDEEELNLLWLQRELMVNDQSFNSYALLTTKPLTAVLTSYPAYLFYPLQDEKSAQVTSTLNTWAIIGTILSTIGFILQFVGLRALHWSAAVLQLVATIAMIAVRVFLRWTLTKQPEKGELMKDHELDWFACSHERTFWEARQQCEGKTNIELEPMYEWSLKTAESYQTCFSRSGITDSTGSKQLWKTNENGNSGPITDEYNHAQTILDIRMRLGYLSNWTNPMTGLSNKLATCIEEVLNAKHLLTFSNEVTSFEWSINADLLGLRRPMDSETQRIRFSAKRKGSESVWQTNRAELDAALSLWVWNARVTEKKLGNQRPTKEKDWVRSGISQQEARTLQLLGPASRSVRRDLVWWVGEELLGDLFELEFEGPMVSSEDPESSSSHLDGIPIGSGTETTKNLQCNNPRKPFHWSISLVHKDEEERTNITIERHRVSGYTAFEKYQHDIEGCRKTARPVSFFLEAEEDVESSKCISKISSQPLEELYMEHLFASFLWAVAKDSNRIIAKVDPLYNLKPSLGPASEFWRTMRVLDPGLMDLATRLSTLGLGRNPREALSMMVPALSAHEKLLVTGNVVRSVHQEGLNCIHSNRWEDAAKLYTGLSVVCQTFKVGEDERVSPDTPSQDWNLVGQALALERFFESALSSRIASEESTEYPKRDLINNLQHARSAFDDSRPKDSRCQAIRERLKILLGEAYCFPGLSTPYRTPCPVLTSSNLLTPPPSPPHNQNSYMLPSTEASPPLTPPSSSSSPMHLSPRSRHGHIRPLLPPLLRPTLQQLAPLAARKRADCIILPSQNSLVSFMAWESMGISTSFDYESRSHEIYETFADHLDQDYVNESGAAPNVDIFGRCLLHYLGNYHLTSPFVPIAQVLWANVTSISDVQKPAPTFRGGSQSAFYECHGKCERHIRL